MRRYLVDLTCPNCLGQFQRYKGEFNRSKRVGKDHFCSKKCSYAGQRRPSGPGNPQYLIPDNRRDEFSPFRKFLRVVKNRIAHHTGRENQRTVMLSTDLTLEYLLNMWKSQGGICPLTGWALRLKPATIHGHAQPGDASLDRIDSGSGYNMGNVRFIAFIANLAKSQFSDQDLFEFCAAVVNYNGLDRPIITCDNDRVASS